jgi:hypothetical protein
MGSPAKLFALVLALTALVAVGTSSAAPHPKRPTNRDQSLRDGCQRPSFVNIILVNSPEWVYVNKDPRIRVASGITRVPHPTPVDQPGTHNWYDFNANLVPDKASQYLVAGSRAAGTNNYGRGADSSGGESEGEEFARLHYEWEEQTLPKFAWPQDGDHTTIWGSWIWDCGHWTQGNTITGERTEFHPLNGIVVNRAASWQARAGEAESDAYISTDGTYAHSAEECARKGHKQSDGTYGKSYFKCVRHHANLRQPVARSYSFFVPAPRRPSGANKLAFRTVSTARSGRVSERVRRAGNGLRVTVTPKSRRTVRYGKEFFVRWVNRSQPTTRLRVTFQDLLVKRANPSGQDAPDDTGGQGQWNMYFELNGFWKLVNEWSPTLANVHDNTTIHLNRSVVVNVPRGHGVELFAMGRECDQPSGLFIPAFGHFAPTTHPCPTNPKATEINGHPNDDPGSILDRYASASAAVGTHTTKSAGDVDFPHSGPINFSAGGPHAQEGDDAYELTYTVSRVR